MPVVIGVDSSTSATKVTFRDIDTGTEIASGRAEHPEVHPPASEQDPTVWEQALIHAMKLADYRGKGIASCLVAAQQHGLVVTDENGIVLRPAKLWNDTTSALETKWLIEQGGGLRGWTETTGSALRAAFTVTKLAWLAHHEPEILARLKHLVLPHDWLTYRLTGQWVTDRGDASGTGYWSPFTEEWLIDKLELAAGARDWSTVLPRVLMPTELAGGVTKDMAIEIGCHPDIPVAPGTGDNMAAALGLGLRKGELAISIGTSGTVFTPSEHPVVDTTGMVAGFASATGEYLPLVCTLNATRVLDATARWIGVDRRQLDSMAESAPWGANGVVFVPYLDGERTPDRPNATGTLVGLRSDTTPSDLARAAVEGVAHNLVEAVEDIYRTGISASDRLIVIGGGSHYRSLVKAIATFSAQVVEVRASQEWVARGAAVQAAAMVRGCSPDHIASEWAAANLGAVSIVEPENRVDWQSLNGLYAAARGED